MFCTKCGTQCQDGQAVCPTCGKELSAADDATTVCAAVPMEPGHRAAFASLILGVSSFLVPFVLGILAIVFGCDAINLGNKSDKAETGIICGAISTGVHLALIFIYLTPIIVGAMVEPYL